MAEYTPLLLLSGPECAIEKIGVCDLTLYLGVSLDAWFTFFSVGVSSVTLSYLGSVGARSGMMPLCGRHCGMHAAATVTDVRLQIIAPRPQCCIIAAIGLLLGVADVSRRVDAFGLTHVSGYYVRYVVILKMCCSARVNGLSHHHTLGTISSLWEGWEWAADTLRCSDHASLGRLKFWGGVGGSWGAPP